MKSIKFGGVKKIRVALGDPSEPRNMRIIAVLSWRSFILISILLALSALFFGYVKFRATLKALEDANVPTAPAKSKFDRATFDTTTKMWNERKLRYQVTVAVPPEIADPSQ